MGFEKMKMGSSLKKNEDGFRFGKDVDGLTSLAICS